jgi:hypothetical protein
MGSGLECVPAASLTRVRNENVSKQYNSGATNEVVRLHSMILGWASSRLQPLWQQKSEMRVVAAHSFSVGSHDTFLRAMGVRLIFRPNLTIT